MDITLLIKLAVGLIVILAVLIFLLLYSKAPKKNESAKEEITRDDVNLNDKKIDLDSLRVIIKDKSSSAKELSTALDLVIKKYGKISKKVGSRTHPDFDIYTDILYKICRHPNTNKNIILKFDKELTRINPGYKTEISEAITKGLNSRGA